MAYWIWYPGEYEIYHAKQQNCSRTERDFSRAAYWHIPDCYHNVVFTRTYYLGRPETITVLAHASAFMEINGHKHSTAQPVTVPAGEVRLKISVMNPTGLPSLYITGDTIRSDDSWMVDPYLCKEKPAAMSKVYQKPSDDPQIFPYHTVFCDPVFVQDLEQGVFYDFGRELYARVHCLRRSDSLQPLQINFGESVDEALDSENCYHYDLIAQGESYKQTVLRAFRYLYIKGARSKELRLCAEHEYVKREYPTSFQADDPLIQKIWDISEETFNLNSRAFFLDGIKRDGWIWSGDAYQSYFINQYLFLDPEINRRTMLALFGREPVQRHINTIIDYSLLWMISFWNQYQVYADQAFLRQEYSKMQAMLAFTQQSRDENGFLIGRPGDWTFIDWSDELDKTGAVCAEQMLYHAALQALASVAEVIGEDGTDYRRQAEELRKKIYSFYWNEEKNGFIDSFASGRNQVNRQANIFAILFDFVTEEEAARIVEHVLLNDEIPQITTPYFKFFELDALGRCGCREQVWKRIVSYWGGMIDQGCTTFWEEYDPKKHGVEHYAMYGNKFEKSLCHAWGASPIYLLGRYFVGFRPTSVGYQTFEITPDPEHLSDYTCTLPLPGGQITVDCHDDLLRVLTDHSGGTLCLNGSKWNIEPGRELCIRLDEVKNQKEN